MVEGKASEGKEIGSLLSLRYALKRQASMGVGGGGERLQDNMPFSNI